VIDRLSIRGYNGKRKVILGGFMGWSGGSELMSEMISAVQALKSAENAQIQELYRRMIVEFENSHDCDTLEECLGEDQRFDFALMYARGVEAGKRGDSVESNPWGDDLRVRADQLRAEQWHQGWLDGVEDDMVFNDDERIDHLSRMINPFSAKAALDRTKTPPSPCAEAEDND
jgi:hypothetical protein